MVGLASRHPRQTERDTIRQIAADGPDYRCAAAAIAGADSAVNTTPACRFALP